MKQYHVENARMDLEDLKMYLQPSIHGKVKAATAVMFIGWLVGLIVFVATLP